jgi:hypothetical protein
LHELSHGALVHQAAGRARLRQAICDACGAAKCDLEQVKGTVLAKKFKDDEIPNGLYILFSEGHVLLYNSDINTLYEFNYGGFRATPAAQRPLHAPRDL